MTVTIKFKTANASFDGSDKPLEISRILREIADQIEFGETERSIHDLNGNRIGSFKVV